ncbi:arylalkylamine N-acetyltransferase 1-like [Dreissena polymorpha]|nr:arylalkylamine N-acetyltransferase 1-like [Dreissena polymorpha]
MSKENFTVKPRETLEQIMQDINAALPLDGLHFELLSEGRMQALVDFLSDYFFPDMPLSKSLGVVADDSLKEILKVRFSEHLSLILIDESSDEIIGIRTAFTLTRRWQLNTDEIKDEKIKTILKFIYQKHNEMNVFKRFDVNVAIQFANLGVRPDFRERGLGCKLIEAALMFFSQFALEMPCITGEGTSGHAQRIFEKYGFETIHTFLYADYKENGEVVFKNMGENVSTKVYVKQL